MRYSTKYYTGRFRLNVPPPPLSFYIPFLTGELPFSGRASHIRNSFNPGLLPPLHKKVEKVCKTTKDYGILTIMVFWVSNSVRFPVPDLTVWTLRFKFFSSYKTNY